MFHAGMTPDPAGLRSFGEANGIPAQSYGTNGIPAGEVDLANTENS